MATSGAPSEAEWTSALQESPPDGDRGAWEILMGGQYVHIDRWMGWDGMGWDGNGMGWDGMGWDGMG